MTDTPDRTLAEAMGMDDAEIAQLRARADRLSGDVPTWPTMEQGREAHDRHRAAEADDVITHDLDEYDWGVACVDCDWAIACQFEDDDESDLPDDQP